VFKTRKAIVGVVLAALCVSVWALPALSQENPTSPLWADLIGVLEAKEKIPPGEHFDWVRSLTFPGSGDWKLIFLAGDGREADFGTTRNSSRRGEVTQVWVRVENREPQQPQSTATFTEFDCDRKTMKFLSQRQFSESDMRGEAKTINALDAPEPILPGTIADSWLAWACEVTKPTPSSAPKKAP
jgi:hypothetical protein